MDEQTAADIAGPIADADEGWEWAICEIMGFRKHAGRCREVTRFGATMLRVDIPTDGDPSKGWTTHLYGGSSIFSYTLTTMEAVLKANRPVVNAYLASSVRRSYREPYYDETDDIDEQEAEIAAEIEANEPKVPEDDAGPVR